MIRRPATRSRGASGQEGITALEILVMVVIVGVIAALGIPAIHTRSKSAVLDANMRSLASIVEEEGLQGYDTSYRATGAGSADAYLSSRLEVLFREAGGKARYVNPCASRTTARTILNSSTVCTDPSQAPPAVFITDAADCRYDVFDSLPYDAGRHLLSGAIVVHFNTPARTVDVFYVDAAGNKSPRVVHVPVA